jgi:hypothetical protein
VSEWEWGLKRGLYEGLRSRIGEGNDVNKKNGMQPLSVIWLSVETREGKRGRCGWNVRRRKK